MKKKENKYTGIGSFNDGFALVRADYGDNDDLDIFGYIDENGCEIVPLKYDYATRFRKGFAEIQLDGKFGFIDTSLEEYFFENKKSVGLETTVAFHMKHNDVIMYKFVGCYGLFNISSYFGTKEDIINQIREDIELRNLGEEYVKAYILCLEEIEKEYN